MHKTGKAEPSLPFHLTIHIRRLHQFLSSLIKPIGTFLIISLRNRPLCKTLSKALLASRKVQYALEPRLLQYLIASVNVILKHSEFFATLQYRHFICEASFPTGHFTWNIHRKQRMPTSLQEVEWFPKRWINYLYGTDSRGHAAVVIHGDNHGKTDKWCSNRVQMKSRHCHHCTTAENVHCMTIQHKRSSCFF